MSVAANTMLDNCLKRKNPYTINVVLLEDNTYEWSRSHVEAAVKHAIEVDRLENEKHGMDTMDTRDSTLAYTFNL